MGEPVAGPSGLEDRLRSALGGAGGGSAGHGTDAARTRVLAGIRRRRLRRLQLSGVAVVVAIGLGVSLPQVLGRAGAPSRTPPPGSHAAAGSVGPSASAPTTGTGFGVANGVKGGEATSTPAPLTSPAAPASCRHASRASVPCGTTASGAAAPRLAAAAVSLERQVNSIAMPATTAPVSGTHRIASLTVRTGSAVTVDLPRLPVGWKWSRPTIAGSPVYHGTGPPVRVRGAGRHAGSQRFLVTTHVVVTVVLDARATPVRTSTATPVEPTAVWALELKVEGR